MKKFLALFMALGIVISSTGCSESEQKYSTTLNPVNQSQSTVVSTMELKAYPQAIVDVINSVEEDKRSADGQEEYQNTAVTVEDIMPGLEAAMNSDGTVDFSMKQTMKYDPSKTYMDDKLTMTVGTTDFDMGGIYMRGDSVYYSKEYMMNSISVGELFSNTGADSTEAKQQVEDMFKGKEYLKYKLDENSAGIDDVTSNFLNYSLNTNKIKQTEDALELLKDFDSYAVTETDNGATLEINSENCSSLMTRLCDYLRGRKPEVSNLYGLQATDEDSVDEMLDTVIGTVNDASVNNFMEVSGLQFKLIDTVAKENDSIYTDKANLRIFKGETDVATVAIASEYTLTSGLTFENLDNSTDMEMQAIPVVE